MKKTYIKITILICALIMVAIALGGILFTLIRINDANADFIKKVTKTNDDFDISRIEIESTDDIQSTMIVFNGFKYLSSRTNPDIGHYGRYVYKDEGSETRYESTMYNQVHFSIEFVDNNGDADFEDVFMNDDFSTVITDVGSGSAVMIYKVDYDGVVDSMASFPEEEESEADEQTKKNNEAQKELDIEAKKKFDELIEEYSTLDNASVIETGLVTSYAMVISTSTFEMPMIGSDIKIYEYDTYIFHPLAHVFANYMYVYILFIVMLIVLMLLTILMMRRMYVNRMNFETRTKSLTRSFAHELKTPLAVTQAYVENWEIVEEKDRAVVTSRISDEVDHMNKIVNTLLNLSAMDSGDVELNLEKVELFEFTRACIERMGQISRERNISVDLKKEDDSSEYFVMADFDMLNMVISNFLSNAIKYGKEKVGIVISSSGANVLFRITNDGETISKKDLKKIWDLFYKKDKARTDRMGSNGVGLAVNKSILELHKAKFGAESGSGVTTFWFEMKREKE